MKAKRFAQTVLFFLLMLFVATTVPPAKASGTSAASVQTAWNTQASGTTNDLGSVDFVDANTGWAVGNSGTIIHTTNGGTTWTSQVSGTTNDLDSVCFTSANTGWAVGANGTVLRTTNGGSAWTSVDLGIANYIYAISFTDASHGCFTCSGGAVYSTTNGGTDWSGSNLHLPVFALCFTGSGNGWAVGSSGVMWHTGNSGATWTQTRSTVGNNLYSVHFSSSLNGWAVGGAPGGTGNILRTTNGGVTTWTAQTPGTTQNLYSVRSTDANTCWAVGANGVIVHTANGGTIWTPQASGTTNALNGVDFADASHGWAVGDAGTIRSYRRYPTAVSISTPPSAVSYAQALTVSGRLLSGTKAVSGALIAPQFSYDNTNWSSLASTRTDATGTYRFKVTPTRKTYYRVRYAGAGAYLACVSRVVSTLPRVYLSNPIAPRSAQRAVRFTIYGYMKPLHVAGTYPVRIYRWRAVAGKWVAYGYVRARAYNYSNYSKYYISTTLPYAGYWRLRAYAPADASHAATWSLGHDTMAVK